jgi:hypothetical protein
LESTAWYASLSYILSSSILILLQDYMYAACSTTARRGALDWAPKFEAANRPVFEALYKSVRDGTETRRSLEFNGRSTYRQDLEKELKEIDDQEIWRAGRSIFVLLEINIDVGNLYRQDRPIPPTGLQGGVMSWWMCFGEDCSIDVLHYQKAWSIGSIKLLLSFHFPQLLSIRSYQV